MAETKFARYMRTKKIPHNVMAERLGLNPSSVSRIAAGIMEPSLGKAVLIESVCRGKVRCRDLVIERKGR